MLIYRTLTKYNPTPDLSWCHKCDYNTENLHNSLLEMGETTHKYRAGLPMFGLCELLRNWKKILLLVTIFNSFNFCLKILNYGTIYYTQKSIICLFMVCFKRLEFNCCVKYNNYCIYGIMWSTNICASVVKKHLFVLLYWMMWSLCNVYEMVRPSWTAPSQLCCSSSLCVWTCVTVVLVCECMRVCVCNLPWPRGFSRKFGIWIKSYFIIFSSGTKTHMARIHTQYSSLQVDYFSPFRQEQYITKKKNREESGWRERQSMRKKQREKTEKANKKKRERRIKYFYLLHQLLSRV